MKYYSQIGQDKYIDNKLKGKSYGVFLDIGAFDGVEQSNSFFFEDERDWSGLCIEPHPKLFQKLKSSRKCICENYAISDEIGEEKFLVIEGYASSLSGLVKYYNKDHKKRIDAEVKEHGDKTEFVNINTAPLQYLLDKHDMSVIDYCSLDVEGAELEVLKSIDFDKTHISYFTIENNYGNEGVKEFLESKGYTLIDRIQFDDVFFKEE